VVLRPRRALGESVASSIVAGNISGRTQTLPLFVKTQPVRPDSTGGRVKTRAIVLRMSLAMAAVQHELTPERKRSGHGVVDPQTRGNHEAFPARVVVVPQPVKEA